MWRLAIALLTIVSLLFLATTRTASQSVAEVPHVPTQTEEKVDIAVQEKPNVPKLLWDISWCESRNDQSAVGLNYRTRVVTNSDGSTSTERYVWSRDIGLYQINDYYHAEDAKKMGYDIYTAYGNTKYALYLYTKNGTRDWSASEACWQDIDAWRAKTKEPFYQ